MNFFATENLKVGYKNTVVVDRINIDLNKGEIICLLGPNGCGKSTILKTITDHIKRIGGSMTVLGKDLNHLSIKNKAKEMSVVLTERINPGMMLAEEVVAIGRYPHTNYFGKLNKKDLEIKFNGKPPIEVKVKEVKGKGKEKDEETELKVGVPVQ